MKTTLLTCLAIVLFALAQTSAGFSNNQEAQAYLQRYGIPKDGLDDGQLLTTVKQYRDNAVLNIQLFGDRVERLLDGLDKKLQDYYQITEPHQRQRFLKGIEDVLRPLEIQGQLTRDHVVEQLTKANKVASSLFWTNEQWKEVVDDVASFVTPPSTWSSWFGTSNSIVKIGEKDPYHLWLDETAVTTYLDASQQQKLKDGLNKVMLQHKDIGSKEWWQGLYQELDGFTRDQIEHITADLHSKVVGFKIFAHDYLGLPALSPVSADEIQDKVGLTSLMDMIKGWIQNLVDWVQQQRQHLDDQATTFLAKKKEQGLIVQDEWVKAIQNAQHSFATYWHDRECEAYRRIGYTEGEIDWIRGYLTNALNPSSPHSFKQIMDDVRQYLNSRERQTKAQVELHVLKLDRLLQAWKSSVLGTGHRSEL